MVGRMESMRMETGVTGTVDAEASATFAEGGEAVEGDAPDLLED